MDKETAQETIQETAIDTPDIIEARMANRLRMEARGAIGY